MGLSWSGRIKFADSGSAEIQPFVEHPRLRRMGQLEGLDQKPVRATDAAICGLRAGPRPRHRLAPLVDCLD